MQAGESEGLLYGPQTACLLSMYRMRVAAAIGNVIDSSRHQLQL